MSRFNRKRFEEGFEIKIWKTPLNNQTTLAYVQESDIVDLYGFKFDGNCNHVVIDITNDAPCLGTRIRVKTMHTGDNGNSFNTLGIADV